MKEPRQRKPRFQRISNPPNVRLTERDLRVLTLLSEHRFLQSHQLIDLVPGSRQHLIRRFGRLYHAGLIERPKQQLQITRRFHSTFAYSLAERGRKELHAREVPICPGVPKLRSAASAFSLTHDLLVSEAVVALRKAATSADIDFRWHHQLLSPSDVEKPGTFHQMHWSVSVKVGEKSKRAFVIPDAAFALSSTSESRAWLFLELDRGTMPVTRTDPTQTCFLRKIHAYKETRRAGILWKQHEIPGFRVLVVTESSKRLKSLQGATASCFQRGESAMFLFASLPELIQAEDVFGPIWQTCSGKKISLVSG